MQKMFNNIDKWYWKTQWCKERGLPYWKNSVWLQAETAYIKAQDS